MSVVTTRKCDVTGGYKDVSSVKILVLKVTPEMSGKPIEEIMAQGFPAGVEIDQEIDKDLSPRAFDRLVKAVCRGTSPYKGVVVAT